MFCTTCGTELGSRETCPACGAPAPKSRGATGADSGLSEEEGRSASGASYPAGGTRGEGASPSPAREPDGKGSKRTPILIGVVLVLVAAAIGGFLVLRPKDDTADGVSTSSGQPLESSQPKARPSTTTSTTEAATTTTLPDVVPALVGMTLEEAQARVEDSGIDLKVVNVANDSKPTGTILKQSPEAEAPFASVITVTVARPPVKTFLSDIKNVEYSGDGVRDTGTATLNAVSYTKSLWMYSCSDYGDDLQNSGGWNLGRRYTRFTAVAGVPDSAASGAWAKFQVYGDGRPLAEVTGSLGKPANIDVDTTGVLRLTLQVTGINCDSYTNDAVLGVYADPVLTSPPPAE